MILTCPDCATSYFVDDDRVPPQGRTVKCSSCGNRWRAMPEGEAEPEATPAPPPPAPVLTTPEPAPSADDDLQFVPAPAPSKQRTITAPKKRPVALYVGAGVAAVLIGAVAAVVLMREQVVAMVPSTASMFRSAGLPVNTLGLVVEDLKARAVLQAGRPVLSVTASIRNTGHSATAAPPIRISLLDKANKTLAVLMADPLNATVPPGGKRYFAVSLPDPPASAALLEIGFEAGVKSSVPLAAEHSPAGASAEHGEGAPAPVEAKPLPATSPDALTPHEQH